MGRVTLQTIADRVGVSRMTVSNAFSRPDQLSDDLRTKVLAAAEELGYVGPDPAARALARGSTGAVGLLLTDSLAEAFTDWMSTNFLAAVAESLARSGLALTLLTAGTGKVVPSRDVAMDGVLAYVCGPDSQDVGWLQRRRLPLVGIDQTPVDGAAHVNIDDRGGARAAAQHVIDLGHRRIGVLNLSDCSPGVVPDPAAAQVFGHAGQLRMLGWQDALTAAGLTPTVALAPFYPPAAAYSAARDLLQVADRPTAVLCYSDVFAGEAIHAAQDLGLRVPEDVSVIGFDDTPLAVQLQLTTVHQDIREKAQAAVTLLTRIFQARQDGTPEPTDHIVLPVQLVVRSTTAAAPTVRA